MAPIAPGAGVDLAYAEHGAGPPVVLVHDLAGDGPELEPMAAGLADAARVITYSRRGYGASTAPEPYAGTTVMEQAEDLAALLRFLGISDAIGAGEGFGALVVLDVLRRHHGLLRAAVVRDPPVLALVPDAARALSDEYARLEAAVGTGGAAAGVAAWLAARPERAGGERTPGADRAVFADYAGLASWPATRGDLRAIAVPVTIVTGPATPSHVLASAQACAALVPGAAQATGGDLAAAIRALLVD
jgi:pimeloyl-ACP methyl ester carboxylesterase